MRLSKKFIMLGVVCLCIFMTSCTSSNARKVIKQIDDIGIVNYNSDSILNDIEVAYNALSDDEKQEVSNYQNYENAKKEYRKKVIEYLKQEAKNEALSLVRNEIKEKLKSPNSYHEYNNKVDTPIILDDTDECSVIVKIKYGATNSFGAEITNNVSALISFSVDIENKSLEVINSLVM